MQHEAKGQMGQKKNATTRQSEPQESKGGGSSTRRRPSHHQIMPGQDCTQEDDREMRMG